MTKTVKRKFKIIEGSLGFSIPSAIAKQLKLKKDSLVTGYVLDKKRILFEVG